MKKFKTVFVLCTMMLVLCGCSIKGEYNMTINEDKSMDFSIITAYDEELIEAMLSMDETEDEGEVGIEDGTETEETVEYTDEEIWQMLESSLSTDEDITQYGFTKERYENDVYKGFKYFKKISNIDEISGETANFSLEEFQNISESVVFVKDGNKYKANFILSAGEDASSADEYDIGIDMSFVVTLPTEPISHNASEVSEDGKTLTWNLLDSDSQNIEFEFVFKDNKLLYLGVALGLTAVLVLIIVVIIVRKNNKNKKSNNNVTQVIPVQPTMQQPQVTPVQPTMQQPQVTPVQPTIQQPQVAPVQPTMQQPQVTPVQPTVQQPQVAPVQPTIQQPQVTPVQPTMQQPQVTPVQPTVQQSQAAPVQPTIQQPQVTPVQPTIQQPVSENIVENNE